MQKLILWYIRAAEFQCFLLGSGIFSLRWRWKFYWYLCGSDCFLHYSHSCLYAYQNVFRGDSLCLYDQEDSICICFSIFVPEYRLCRHFGEFLNNICSFQVHLGEAQGKASQNIPDCWGTCNYIRTPHSLFGHWGHSCSFFGVVDHIFMVHKSDSRLSRRVSCDKEHDKKWELVSMSVPGDRRIRKGEQQRGHSGRNQH